MKTKSNNNPSKLQSEAVKEFEKKFPCSLHVEKFLSDQIQKAYSKGREEVLKELRVRIDTWGGFEDEGGNLCHYDSQIIEYLDDLSIQSKGKIK